MVFLLLCAIIILLLIKSGGSMSIEGLLSRIEKYNKEEIEKVKKAYSMAEKAHAHQKRESGEPYIIHPIAVCMNLIDFHADGASLCAGLLHDVVEDTDITLEDIEKEFGKDVAKLVDGVTKISNLHYNTKDEATNANIRRLINSLNEDVRIIIIKLCDRLHNMRTLEHKEPHKQIRSANETLSIFVPLAYFIGAFRLKCELEDLCFKYLEPEEFKNIKEKLKDIEKEYESCLKHADEKVGKILKENNITYTNRVKMLNPYHIHEKLNQGYKLNNIHDLVNFKVIVDTEEDCYRTLGLIHKLYTPVNNKFKDYIACPKTNKYRSIHTTVFTPDNQLLQFQIKTEEMDYLNTFGLAAYWRMYREQGPSKMKTELKSNYQFFNNLQHLNDYGLNDFEYLELVKNEIFTTNIYVYTLDGAVVELPNGASVIDFAYKVHTDIGNHINKVYVNGKEVKLSYKLQNKDRVMILPSDKAHPEEEWLDYVVTSNARRYITKYLKQ